MFRIDSNSNHTCRWLFAAIALLLAAGVASADDRRRAGPPDPGRHVERLTEELDLSDEQALAIQSILEQHAIEIEALRTSLRNGEIDRETLHEAARADRDQTHVRIGELLDDDQAAAFESLRAEREERRGRGRERGDRER